MRHLPIAQGSKQRELLRSEVYANVAQPDHVVDRIEHYVASPDDHFDGLPARAPCERPHAG